VSLKRLQWCVTGHWKGYPEMWLKVYSDVSLKRLRWWVTGHWKGYPDMWLKVYFDALLKRLRWWVMGHWKCYSDMSPKRLPGTPLKRLIVIVDFVFTELQMKLLPDSSGYKNTSQERELICIQTHRSHTMGSKEPKSWSPRWVRQNLREKNNVLPPNDPNHDEKTSADA
jgi:hypothetical protein